MTKFKVGDRVVRRADVYDPMSPLRHGAVIRVYSRYGTQHGDYPELYNVQWDDGEEERAFLPHGLDLE